MKILQIIPSLSPLRGGPSRVVLDEVRALRAAGVDVEVATTNDDGSRTMNIPVGQRTDYEGMPVWFFRRFSPPVYVIREYAISSSFVLWLWRHAADYDLIHVNTVFSFPSTAAMLIARLKKIPYIIRPMGMLCSWCLRRSETRKKIYLGLVERSNLKHAAAINFTAEFEAKDSSRELFPDRQFIIPHGINPVLPVPDAALRLRDRLKVPQDTVIILFLSRVHPKKGLDLLIPALANFRNENFKFVLAGNADADYEKVVLSLVDRSGLGEKVLRVPFLKSEEKGLFFQGADLLALTSYSENFALVVLEALATGTPVLISREVGLADFVQKINARYITDVTVESVTNALKSFFSDITGARSDRERIGRAAQNEFSWQKIARNLADKYREVLKGNES